MNSIKIDKKIINWRLNKEEKVFKENHAPKRHKELPCEVHKVKVKGESWTIFVGLFENKPYEIFGGLSKFIEVPKKIKTGKIVKTQKKNNISMYDLIAGEGDDEFIVKDITNTFENKTEGVLTRMVSLNLRHGTPIQFVVEQLQKDEFSDITSFSKVVARVLKQYIIDGTKSSLKCDQCGSDQMVFQEGCFKCLSCSTSKCG